MFARLALLFILVPIVELALLMMLADWTNWRVALIVVLVTGLSGAWLIRHQGWRTIRRIREEVSQGHMPGDALLDGVLIFSAGLLLLTPGIVTDVAAIVLLIPWSRRWIKAYLARRFKARFQMVTRVTSGGRTTVWQSSDGQSGDSQVVDAPSRRVVEPPPPALPGPTDRPNP